MKLLWSFLLLALVTPLSVSAADGRIIVNASNQAEVSTEEIKRIYLGQQKKFSNGESIIALLPRDKPSVKIRFLRNIVDKSHPRYRAFWARLVFIGEGIPPKELDSTHLIEQVISDSRIIAVVAVDIELPEGIRVIMEF